MFKNELGQGKHFSQFIKTLLKHLLIRICQYVSLLHNFLKNLIKLSKGIQSFHFHDFVELELHVYSPNLSQ